MLNLPNLMPGDQSLAKWQGLQGCTFFKTSGIPLCDSDDSYNSSLFSDISKPQRSLSFVGFLSVRYFHQSLWLVLFTYVRSLTGSSKGSNIIFEFAPGSHSFSHISHLLVCTTGTMLLLKASTEPGNHFPLPDLPTIKLSSI